MIEGLLGETKVDFFWLLWSEADPCKLELAPLHKQNNELPTLLNKDYVLFPQQSIDRVH